WENPLVNDIQEHHALVDPVLGRFVLHNSDSLSRMFSVCYGYGFAGDLGGGPYPRQQIPAARSDWVGYVHSRAHPDESCFSSVSEAVRAFRKTSGSGIIRILDSATYEVQRQDFLGGPPDGCCSLPEGHRTLTIEAASGQVPCLRGELYVRG